MDSDDNMQNATLISNLPPPMTSSLGFSTPTQQKDSKGTPEVSSYMDLIKDLDINKMKNQQQKQQQMSPIAPAQQQQKQVQQQMPPQMTPQMKMQQQTPPQMTPQMTQQMQMQQQMPSQNIMQQMQQKETAYTGSIPMPQSAPISASQNVQGFEMQQSPLISNLLPDPMFFQPPPPPLKERRVKPVKIEEPVKKSPFNFDMAKIKPAILVTAIVFALLSWGAPMIARRITWTVDSITGKFTPSGLIVMSLLTGGIFLGVTEIIRNYGSGV